MFLNVTSLLATLFAAVLEKDEFGNLVRKAGIMTVVHSMGDIGAGDPIRIELRPYPTKR